MSGQKIAVLMGGISSERKISFSSGKGVMKALQKLGYKTKAIDVTEDLSALIKQLKTFKPEVVFNALHGKGGEDGCIQGLLNWMKIPYTHSGVLASSLGMDKEMTRQIATQAKVPVAKGGLKTKEEFQKMKLPLVVKPNDEGSSIGVSLVLKESDRKKVKWPKNKKLLVEEYIPGRELSVAVLDGKALGTLELKPKKGWYDFKNKYQAGAVQHLIPAPVSPVIAKKLCQYAEKMHNALGARGVTRCDFRLDKNKIIFLEINTNPGMTPTSLVPDMAKLKNLTYEKLVEKLVRGGPMRLEFKLKKKGKSRWKLKALVFLLGIAGLTGLYLSPVGQESVLLCQKAFSAVTARANWQLNQVIVEGHKRTDKSAITDALMVQQGQNMDTISLTEVRQNLLKLPWIKNAIVERHLPDKLVIHITEKTPIALWQNNQTYHPLDEMGNPIQDDKLLPADLILVVGSDAPENTLALLAALEQVPSINSLVRSAVRIEKRRWNLYLMDPEKGLIIMLPETGFDKALKRLEHHNKKENLFKKEIDAINITLEGRYIVTPKKIHSKKKGKKK